MFDLIKYQQIWKIWDSKDMLNLIKLFGSSVFIKFFHINIVFLYCFMLLLFFAGLIQIKYIAVILIKNKKWMLMSNKNVFELFLMRVAPSFALNAHKNEIKIQKTYNMSVLFSLFGL